MESLEQSRFPARKKGENKEKQRKTLSGKTCRVQKVFPDQAFCKSEGVDDERISLCAKCPKSAFAQRQT